MKKFVGLPASPGIAIGNAFQFRRTAIDVSQRRVDDIDFEVERLNQALIKAQQELIKIARDIESKVGKEQAHIFEAQAMILQDPELLERVRKILSNDRVNVEIAWSAAIDHYAKMLSGMDNEVFAARSADIRDIGQRVLSLLVGANQSSIALTKPSIILAEDLSPSDTILFDREKTLAFCTALGGNTSHVAILSKALGIPCVVGLGAEILRIPSDTPIVVDGNEGHIIAEPDEPTLAEAREKIITQLKWQKHALSHASQPAKTRDGKHIEVGANIGSIEDAINSVEMGADGVGLFRTEFLFLDRETPPSEDEQVSIYLQIFQVIGNQRPIVVRTLDIGGDKPASYITISSERNPFLGVRGLRLSLQNPLIFESQLCALLRAGVGYDLRIMFPMVSSIEEIHNARSIFEKAKTKLQKEKVQFAKQVQLGIMIEVPSIAILANKAASLVDFFSIGTNDLAQYTLAADRTNPSVASLADALHPAVLMLIHNVVKSAHRFSKWVGLCGELAADRLALPLLLGLGLDELSVSPRFIPLLKESIRHLNHQETISIAKHALRMTDAIEVRNFLMKFTYEKF